MPSTRPAVHAGPASGPRVQARHASPNAMAPGFPALFIMGEREWQAKEKCKMPDAVISFDTDAKAVSKFEGRRATASSKSSAEWARVEPALREKCFFSARVNDAEIVGKMRELIGKAIDSSKRGGNEAYVSQEKFIGEMKNYLRGRGYATGGSALTDITSRHRLGLIYQMNVEEAREYARYVRGQDADALDMYPAQEFLRVESRRVPRADWQTRWRAAGGKVYGGRMIALKSDTVWTNLSRFGRPYPPFDYGSGMGVEDIDRDEAVELGLLPDDEPADEIPDFDIVLEAEVSLDRIPEDMLEKIVRETPNARIEGGKLKMSDKKPLPTYKDMGLDSARTWSSKPFIKENLIEVSEAKKRLHEGFVVEASDGGNVKFDDNVLRHWEERIKRADDIYGRLERINIASDCVRKALEVWKQPNGQLMYLSVFESTTGKIKGIAVAVSNDNVVRTWFVNRIQELDKCRKGELVYKR